MQLPRTPVDASKLEPIDELEALLGLVPKLVTMAIVSEMCTRAGVPRSRGAVLVDAEAGRLRTGRIVDRYTFTVEAEAARYVAELVAEKERRRVSTPTRKFFEARGERSEDRAA